MQDTLSLLAPRTVHCVLNSWFMLPKYRLPHYIGLVFVLTTMVLLVGSCGQFSDKCYHCVEAGRNVMAHAQKPDFVFRAKRTSPFKSAGASVQSTTGSRGVRISGSNAGYTMFRGSVKSTGYPFHSPVSLSLTLPCVTVRHHISAGVYQVAEGQGIRAACHKGLQVLFQKFLAEKIERWCSSNKKFK